METSICTLPPTAVSLSDLLLYNIIPLYVYCPRYLVALVLYVYIVSQVE